VHFRFKSRSSSAIPSSTLRSHSSVILASPQLLTITATSTSLSSDESTRTVNRDGGSIVDFTHSLRDPARDTGSTCMEHSEVPRTNSSPSGGATRTGAVAVRSDNENKSVNFPHSASQSSVGSTYRKVPSDVPAVRICSSKRLSQSWLNPMECTMI
jgi:hypothetical protein